MWAFIRHDQTCKRPFFATPDLHFLYGVPLKSLLCILLCHGPKKRPMPLMILFIGWVCFTCTHQLYASRMDLPQHKVSQLCSAPLHCFSAVLTACKFSGGPVSNQICRMHLCSALTYPLMFGCTLVSGASERWTLPDLPVKPQPLCHITAACTQVVAEHLLLHPPAKHIKTWDTSANLKWQSSTTFPFVFCHTMSKQSSRPHLPRPRPGGRQRAQQNAQRKMGAEQKRANMGIGGARVGMGDCRKWEHVLTLM